MAKKRSHRVKHHISAHRKPRGHEIGGIAFVGCIVVGLALGLLLDYVAVGVLFGVGIGFIVMAILRALVKR